MVSISRQPTYLGLTSHPGGHGVALGTISPLLPAAAFGVLIDPRFLPDARGEARGGV